MCVCMCVCVRACMRVFVCVRVCVCISRPWLMGVSLSASVLLCCHSMLVEMDDTGFIFTHEIGTRVKGSAVSVEELGFAVFFLLLITHLIC